MPMRIAIDARLNAYREGGIAEYTRRMVTELARLESPERYLILEHIKAQTSLIPEGARHLKRVRVFTPPHHRFERTALALELVRIRPRILHSPDFIPPRFGSRHFVITVHDLNFLHFPQFQTPDSLAYYKGNIQQAVDQADCILADSEATRRDLHQMLGTPLEKIKVHLLGVPENFRPLAPEQVNAFRARYHLPREYILFVGTFEPRKNLPGLLKAYQQLRQTMPDAPPLVIAGRRGWLFESIFEQVTTLGLRDQVRWLEDVPSADLPALYNAASVLTLPSFYEGFGFPVLEAMACGIPTVASDRGSLPEVAGDTGILIDPDQADQIAEALHLALTDSTFRARSSAAGLARAGQFTWERTAQVVLEVYRRLG